MQSSTTDFGHRVLGVYFREQDGIPLLDAAGEIALASTIAEQRDELWVSLLDYVPFLEPIATFVGMRAKELHRTKDAEVETAKLVAACARLAEAARAVRARDLARHQATLRACRAELVACTRGGDPDGTIRAAVLEKIVALGRGERRDEGLLALRMPRAGSQPFARYLAAVRVAEARLSASMRQFVLANLRLVITIARRIRPGRFGCHMQLPDLIQEGNQGLIRAVERFDPRRGFRFSTYGSWWIRHAISRALAGQEREIRLPVHKLAFLQQITLTARELFAKTGEDASAEDLAATMGVAVPQVRAVMQLGKEPLSLDAPCPDLPDLTIGASLATEEADPAEGIDHATLLALVQEKKRELSEMELSVIEQRFAEEPRTLKEIGEQYGLSRERIRQLEQQALNKLRRALRRERVL